MADRRDRHHHRTSHAKEPIRKQTGTGRAPEIRRSNNIPQPQGNHCEVCRFVIGKLKLTGGWRKMADRRDRHFLAELSPLVLPA
jgi:hypothetical protein